MAIYLGTRTRRDIIIHIGLIISTILIFLLSFFFLYLPWTTNHDQSLTVPDLRKMSLEKVENLLEDRSLEPVVSDCTFVAGIPPYTVLSQYPFPMSLVKEGRKVYLTVTTGNPPKIRMPDLVSNKMSYRSAEAYLRNLGLVVGSITYRPALEENAVLEQSYLGKIIEPGAFIAKGSKVDLVIGNGIGNEVLDVPNLRGKTLDEALLTIKGSDLQIGTILNKSANAPLGTVVEQRPGPGEKIRAGQIIDIWIAGQPDDDTGEGTENDQP